MFKQLSKIGMLCCLLAVATSAFAQEESKKENAPEYPRYGFWSNWSVGADFLWPWQFENGGWGELRSGSNLGFNVFLERELNHVWAVRFNAGFPSLMKADETATADATTSSFKRYRKFMFDIKFSFNNAIAGYNPDRFWSIYLLAGGGLVNSINADMGFGNWGIAAEGGLGASFRICPRFTMFLEYKVDILGDAPQIFQGKNHHLDGTLSLGAMYNFGTTKVDQELIAQRSLLTQENFDALNEQVSGLEEQVAIAKANEERLETRITELENELAAVKKANSAEADSLRRMINQIKSEQSKFYALPFSVLFGVDQSSVSATQQTKLKAIAKVMNDNPEAKFTIVGHCDYTGSDAYNMKLSQKRAENVKKVLVDKYGVAADRLNCEWKGKSEAYGDIQLSINRRVAFYRVIE